jgi:hypothetical protein
MLVTTNEVKNRYSTCVSRPLANRASTKNGNSTANQNAAALTDVGNEVSDAVLRSFVGVEGVILV